MRYEITKEKDDINAFAVCLIPVPDFPENRDKLWDVVRTPLMAVIGAVFDEDGWSFTTLSRDEKHVIGDLLVDNGALPNEWWWCKQFEE